MSFTGNLKTVAFPDILQLLSTGKKTGILSITKGAAQKEVCFKAGNIIYATSRGAEEDYLGGLLLRRGRIVKADLDRALHMHKTTGKRLGQVLVDMGLFSREEITDCLKLQVEEIVYNLFSWESGEFIFSEGKLPTVKDILVELQTVSLIMEGTRRIDEWLEIQRSLPKENQLLKVVLSPNAKSDEIVLSPEEFQILWLINGERSLPDIVAASPIGEFATYRGMYKLILSNLVIVSGVKAAAGKENTDEEEQLWWLVLRLYTACFDSIRRKLERKLGPDNSCITNMFAAYRKGVWAYFTGLGSSDFKTNFENFRRTANKIPKEARLHKLLSGLNHILGEQLAFVGSMLGANVLRSLESEIKKEISIPLAERRSVSSKYELEENIFQVLKDSKKIFMT
ncbi:MAG: DUF4388 domain-containing protein [Candidatus Zixiibacteriota bacterium]